MTAVRYRHPSSYGGIMLTAGYGADGLPEYVEILHADPVVLFGGRFLRDIAAGACYKQVPLATVDRAGTGGVFRVGGRNRNLVYLITEADPLLPCSGGTVSCPPGGDCPGHRISDTFLGRFPD